MAEAADGAESIDAAAGVDSQCAGSPITRARKNLAALEALAAAEERGSATAEEIAAMEAYSGWGGAQKAFSENAEGEWGEIRDRLKELLSDDEFASQRHTVLTAFYTPAPVIGAIYDALREAGIGHGDTPAAILEPGCGTGNFMRLAPADLALDFHGVELDPISARIAQALCPEAHITAAGLEECRVSPASFDAAIGNVPYSGDIKIDECVRNILVIRDRTEGERGAQLVFVDSSTPASGRWNIQDDVRRRLIEAGVPESEIACVTDAKGKSKLKEALYEKVRSGDIRILLGSTTTLGTGTNVQTRLAAIHDLDCPWRPSDLEQRLGRIVRQGNTFDHVHDFRYVSTGTFDSYLYSIVERKQRFISQVFTNKSPVRTMDDLDETVLSLAQMKQIAEGDPTVAERMDVENKIGQLKLMMASHLEGLADVQHKIETQYRPLVEALTAQRDMLADDEIPFAEADLVRQQTLGSKDSFLTVGGTHIADKEEAIRALRRAAYGVRPGCEEIIGTYRGLSVVCRRQHVLDDDWLPYIGLAVDAAKHVHMSDRVFPSGEKGAFTVLTQMDRIIARDAKGPAEIELKLREAQHALADAQKAAKEPFPKQTELDEAEQRLAVLEQERIEAEAQRQREQAQRAEAEAAAIEEGVEDEREAERKHERAAVADDEARERGRVAELRRQGLICEDSAAHAAATATACGIASGCPDDVAEAARCSAAASVREERDGGEKHKAGM